MATTVNFNENYPRYGGQRSNRLRVTVPAGQTSPWQMVTDDNAATASVGSSGTCVAVASPGSSGTVLIEATWSPVSVVQGDIANGTSNSIAVQQAGGAVAANTAVAIQQATAVRFTAATAAGVCELARS